MTSDFSSCRARSDAAARGGATSSSRWSLTHVTIAAVTIFLHRRQAHRALDLHPVVGHFFRFWLWLTTGMVTKEWVGDPPQAPRQVRNAGRPAQPADARHRRRCFWQGAELYRAEAKNPETMREVRPRHARRLDRAQRLHALLVAGRRPDARRRTSCCSAPLGAHDLGGADGVDPDHGGRRHQRHRPLLGLPQLRVRRRVDQHRALGHPDRRRGAAQQPPRLRRRRRSSRRAGTSSTSAGCTSASSQSLGLATVRKVAPKLRARAAPSRRPTSRRCRR